MPTAALAPKLAIASFTVAFCALLAFLFFCFRGHSVAAGILLALALYLQAKQPKGPPRGVPPRPAFGQTVDIIYPIFTSFSTTSAPTRRR